MSSQAFSDYNDLLFGNGELYFLFDNDDEGWKHLGNASEFVITAETTNTDKHASLNKKRELVASVTTQVSMSGYAILNEYDPKNLASCLFGNVYDKQQSGVVIREQNYSVPAVPGIITMIDANQNRLYSINNVKVEPTSTLEDCAYWADSNKMGDITTQDEYMDTFVAYSMGGKIKIDVSAATITREVTFYVCITKAPDAVGDLYGMSAIIYEGGSAIFKDFGSGIVDTMTLSNGTIIEFSVTGSTTFSVMGNTPESGLKGVIIHNLDEYAKDFDYVATAQSCRAGMVKIPSGSRIRQGDMVKISYIAPNRKFTKIAGGNVEKLTGQLLFVADNTLGPNYVLEAWKVIIHPSSDVTGLIADDFGNFRLDFSFLINYEAHPESPYYTLTLTDYGKTAYDSSVYDENY